MLALALALLALLALLAVPLELRFRLSTDPAARRQLDLRWLFGLVRLDLSRPGAAARPAPGRRRKPGASRRLPPIAALADPALRQRLLRFAADAWRAIGKRGLRLRLRIGLGDPADTGRLWGLLGPLAGYLSASESATIAVEPDFVDCAFAANGGGTLRIVPLRLLYLTFGLLLSPPVRRALRRAR